MENKKTIVVVLRSGGDFSFRDVELMVRHINGKWQSKERPCIICLWDKASQEYDLGNFQIIPLTNNYPKWWSRMMLYSPEMEQYRPFLYIDLDTAVIQSLEKIFELVGDPRMFIPLEDFYQKGQLATGLAWIPANSKKINAIWKAWKNENLSGRMDMFLRKVVKEDKFWQQLTNTIYDFKPKPTGVLSHLPEDAVVVCFHGKPRIYQCAEASMSLQWVKDYVNQHTFFSSVEVRTTKKKVTVIIPYNVDRGYLKDAIASVPDNVQLILSQGAGCWPQNFNKALKEAEGDYIKYLHEDDMLTPNCIEDSIAAIEEQGVDFIHGQVVEIFMNAGRATKRYTPKIKIPTLEQLLADNVIHSASTMYRREVFEKVGLLNESPQVHSFEEFEFNVRCLQMGMRIGYCNSALAFYRRHPKQIIRTVDTVTRKVNRQKTIEKYNESR